MNLTESQIDTAMEAALVRLIPQMPPHDPNFNAVIAERRRAYIESVLKEQVLADHVDVGTAGSTLLVVLVNAEGDPEQHEREIPAWLATLPDLNGVKILVAAESI